MPNVRIMLEGGVYRLDAPLLIRWGNGKATVGRLTITGPKQEGSEPAVLSGGKVLSGFTKLKGGEMPARMPVLARSHVGSIHLSETLVLSFGSPIERGFGYPIAPRSELFFRGQPMPIAMWPNDGFARINIPATARDKERMGRYVGLDGKSLIDLADEPELSAYGYFARDWADEEIRVEAVDVPMNVLILRAIPKRGGIRAGQRIRVQNALSELDQPGEWYLDRTTSTLYFWPLAQVKDGDLEVSVTDTLLRFESAKNVRVENLTFEEARGDAILLKDSENVVIERCIIRNVGNRAMVISGGRNSGLKEVEIDQTAEGGVVLDSGDRKTLTPAGLFVEKSKIQRFSRLGRTNRPAVAIEGVGNRVEGNVIADAPHAAIMFWGNDHRIVSNDISRVVLETDDAGAIYTGRDWTARGTVIEDNFVHDIGGMIQSKEGVMGIYLDDMASGIVVRGNVFARVSQPVFIGGGRDNVVENNLFYFSSPAIHLDARGLGWARASALDPNGTLQKRLTSVPFNRAPYSDRYPHLSNIIDDEPAAPKYNLVRNNMFVASEPFGIDKDAESGVLLENNRVESDGIFLKYMPPEQRTRREHFEFKKK
ncbi:MAG: right-handed parallel beta-helix repeat-containing protein [Burkholderiales bacterium]|nr:right-handed parallel beta-helix repeat-containing protein [Burkholderiales bacterium]